jgi:hypothetical protein
VEGFPEMGLEGLLGRPDGRHVVIPLTQKLTQELPYGARVVDDQGS